MRGASAAGWCVNPHTRWLFHGQTLLEPCLRDWDVCWTPAPADLSYILLQTNLHPLTKLWHTKMLTFGCEYLLKWGGLRICGVQRGTTGDTEACGVSSDLQGKWGSAVNVGTGGALHSGARISSRRGRWPCVPQTQTHLFITTAISYIALTLARQLNCPDVFWHITNGQCDCFWVKTLK